MCNGVVDSVFNFSTFYISNTMIGFFTFYGGSIGLFEKKQIVMKSFGRLDMSMLRFLPLDKSR